MKALAALLLSLNLALSGCAGCYIDAVPQQPSSKPTMLDCDPLLAAR
jgi:hypothetical protein